MEEIEPKRVHHFYSTIAVLGVVGAVLIVFGWMAKQWYQNSGIQTANPSGSAPRSAASASGLGAEIYDQVKNPVQDRIPNTAPQVVNPVSQVYKNPFE